MYIVDTENDRSDEAEGKGYDSVVSHEGGHGFETIFGRVNENDIEHGGEFGESTIKATKLNANARAK